MKKLILLLLLSCNVYAGSVTLSWTPPTQNTDGTVLTDLTSYNIYQGITTGVYTITIPVVDATVSTFVIDNLVAGTYYFVATAVNSVGTESSFSNETIKTILPSTPNPPGLLTVQDLRVFTLIKQVDNLILLPVGTTVAGTVCDVTKNIMGHYVIPRNSVTWSGTVEPLVVVAKCS